MIGLRWAIEINEGVVKSLFTQLLTPTHTPAMIARYLKKKAKIRTQKVRRTIKMI